MTHWYIDRLASRGETTAMVTDGRRTTYAELAARIAEWDERLAGEDIEPGTVVTVHGDHSPDVLALILALANCHAVVAPLAALSSEKAFGYHETAGATHIISVNEAGAKFERREEGATHPLVEELRGRGRAGLILFSSGSTGAPKACLLDLDALLERTREPRRGWRTLVFLLLDHIGGINTLISVLGVGGTAIIVHDRTVEAIVSVIEREKVELLPTTPTFLKLLLISGAAETRNLASLKLITYGTEVMPEATLTALRGAFPGVRLKQTYGLSEIGILPTKSRDNDSPWMKIGGNDVETKIVDGILKVRAPTAMLGYLNASSPFDAEGWLDTKDRVETDGEWLRVLGRESELINVGGEKVHPAEIENVLLQAPNVADVTVTGRANPVTGAVVVATVVLAAPEGPQAVKARLTAFCAARLEDWKRPAMFKIAEVPNYSARFKKLRVTL